MTNLLTPERIAELNTSFSKLKLTAKSAEDVARWFKKHPEVIPGFPMQHAKKLRVENSSDEVTYDQKKKTAYDHQTFTFEIESIDVKAADKIFMEVTGMKPGENISDLNSAYFSAKYVLNMDALEWKFVALEALASIEDEDINDPEFNVIYQNILAKYYPHYKWETFAALWQADILPNDDAALDAVLKRPAPADVSLAIPRDFSL